MREIKFRAWDTKQNKMDSPEEMGKDELTLNPDGRGYVNVSGTSQRLSQYFPWILPLQFTSWADKNGKEIYEGDIVRDLKYPEQIFQIIFDNGKFQFELIKPEEHKGCIDDKITPEEVEVIGDIYSNPELMK